MTLAPTEGEKIEREVKRQIAIAVRVAADVVERACEPVFVAVRRPVRGAALPCFPCVSPVAVPQCFFCVPAVAPAPNRSDAETAATISQNTSFDQT